MNPSILKHALTSALYAAHMEDQAGFVVAVRVAQSLLPKRLDLVQMLDAAVQYFPGEHQLQAVYMALFESEDPTN